MYGQKKSYLIFCVYYLVFLFLYNNITAQPTFLLTYVNDSKTILIENLRFEVLLILFYFRFGRLVYRFGIQDNLQEEQFNDYLSEMYKTRYFFNPKSFIIS